MLMWICLPLWCVFSISHGDFSLLYNVKKALLLHSEAACQTFLFSAHGIHSTSASSHHVGFVKCTLHVQSRWPLTPDYFLSQSQNFLEKSMKTVPEFPSVFYSGSLGRPPSFLLVLCLFFLELCKWEQSVAWRYFGSFALPRLCTCRWRTAIFVSLSSSLGPFLCLLQISHLPIQGHTRHSPCSSLIQPQAQGRTLTSNLPPVCSLTLKKLVNLPWPLGKRNVLLKEISELRVVESQILKKTQQLEELIMLVFLHPFGW